MVKHGECLCGKTKGCLYLDSDLASLYPDSQSSKHMRHMCTYVLDVEAYVYICVQEYLDVEAYVYMCV